MNYSLEFSLYSSNFRLKIQHRPYVSLVKLVVFYLEVPTAPPKILPNLFRQPYLFGSSRPEVFCKKGVLRNLTKFTGKHLCQRLFFNKVEGLLKNRLWRRCFAVNFVKFLRNLSTQSTSSGCFCLLKSLFWSLSATPGVE